MNNEIGRKITSLTLMTIMLAGGMTIAAPSMMVPEAQAAGSLYVSAENAMFNNSFGGAQIVEVVVLGISTAVNESAGEPTVKVNDNQLRMAQATDGNWYGYFGSETEVEAADAADNFLDIGQDSTPSVLQGDFNEASDVWKPSTGAANNGAQTMITNVPKLSSWNNTDSTNETPAGGASKGIGQIGVAVADWPFIQLYDFTIETFDVVLEQAGADEVVTINYDSGDMDDYAGMVLDRNSASQESDIHLTITDNQLNIDPTGEDVVSFYVASGVEGVSWMNRTIGGSNNADILTVNWTATDYKAYDNYFDDNGKLIINNATNGGSSVLVNIATADDATADNYMIFYEGGENSGIFYNTDDADNSSLEVDDYAKRGFTATFDYNDSAQSFLVANDFGVLTMDASSVGDEWNSGEALTVTLIDQDLNKNSASSEDLYLTNTTNGQLVPSLQIGSPLMVKEGATDTTSISNYSNIAFYTNATVDGTAAHTTGGSGNWTLHTGQTTADLDAMNSTNTYFNYDFSAFTNGTNPMVGACLVEKLATGSVSQRGSLACTAVEADADVAPKGLIRIGAANGFADADSALTTSKLEVELKTTQAYGQRAATSIPYAIDIFSFGAGVNNAIYRLELAESDSNTGVFEGTIEYKMLNQINIDIDSTYTDLSTVDSDIDIIVEQDMTDEDSPRVNYFDLGADGVSTQIADQLEAPTHSGVVSFDSDNYKIADTVVVTLDDQDMNTDSELIDVYTTNANDRVGDADATTLATGLVLDITFDDVAWINTNDDATCTNNGATGDDGLEATGFTLVETGTPLLVSLLVASKSQPLTVTRPMVLSQ